MTEYRRILLDGSAVQVVRHGDELRASDGRTIGVDDAVHLPPSEPTKIIAVHLNYPSRSDEFMTKLPAAPTYFHKPITALNSHRGAVVRPAGCRWLNYEGEIVIVIGRTCRNVSPAEAGDYIAGYSVGNDYGLHDFRDTDAGSMLRVKGSDTLAPVGPGLVTDWDFRGKTIRTLVNGVVVQEDSTDTMEWDMNYLVADLARTITLVPGDMIYSGTPANSAAGATRRRCRRRGRRPRDAHQHDRRRPHPDPHRRGRPADLERRGRLNRARRRLGVPRHPHPLERFVPLPHRREGLRMINIDVDMNKCQHYGQCVFEAPEVFVLNADDRLEYQAEAPDEMLADLEAAADVCPMQAILITKA
ncbi:MAG: fumarylacetoacetate hydrolase family protein [Ilumatobacteraceae bacterium]|nr:fumarylacetoacetate hydrolase family protein [Ilumatobacteraceae bacterium]